jgi:hypothetical protein
MLDPRIYRTGLVGVALAVLVLAFSLQNQTGASRARLAPDALNNANPTRLMASLAHSYPVRTPGSDGDRSLADAIGSALATDHFAVSQSSADVRTAHGTRRLQTVLGTRAGLASGTIVVVAHRDGSGQAALSGTATLLELASALGGETLHHTVVLASISGTAGAAGAANLAGRLQGPIDGVIVLGDLANAHVTEPVVVPWSNGTGVAPPALRNTVAAAISSQAGLHAGGTDLGGQFAHLAFPFTIGAQGPFGRIGDPAVLLSVSSEHTTKAGEPVDPTRFANLGMAVLETVNALDNAPAVPAASAYLLFSGKVVPSWAIRLLVLALILPVLAVAVDGFARARRRGHDVLAWVVAALVATIPFALSVLIVIGAKAVGILHAVPPGPVGPGVIPIDGAGIGLLVVLALVLVGLPVLLRSRLRGPRKDPGGAIAALIVMCVATLVIWLSNPFAAALVVPALHLWLWLLDPEVRIRRVFTPVLLLIGLAPLVLVALYYALTTGYSAVGLAWTGALMIAGGHIGLVTALEWCVIAGCTVTVSIAALTRARVPKPGEIPVTIRGPVTYAGPGSLGGTESAFRARR